MEYAEGGDLYSLIKNYKKNKKSFTEEEIWKWTQEVLQGMDYLHSNNIIHRDIKCLNLFLTKNKNIKIGDLGVSKIVSNINALHCTRVGTPLYLAPELIKQLPYDFKVDMWSVGCSLYHIACLEPPFAGDNLIVLGNSIVKTKQKTLPKNFSFEFCELIEKLLSKKPENRPSAKEAMTYLPELIKHKQQNTSNKNKLVESVSLQPIKTDNTANNNINEAKKHTNRPLSSTGLRPQLTKDKNFLGSSLLRPQSKVSELVSSDNNNINAVISNNLSNNYSSNNLLQIQQNQNSNINKKVSLALSPGKTFVDISPSINSNQVTNLASNGRNVAAKNENLIYDEKIPNSIHKTGSQIEDRKCFQKEDCEYDDVKELEDFDEKAFENNNKQLVKKPLLKRILSACQKNRPYTAINIKKEDNILKSPKYPNIKQMRPMTAYHGRQNDGKNSVINININFYNIDINPNYIKPKPDKNLIYINDSLFNKPSTKQHRPQTGRIPANNINHLKSKLSVNLDDGNKNEQVFNKILKVIDSLAIKDESKRKKLTIHDLK